MRINPYTAVRGQALVEFLVAMMVLIPLFFGMGWVAKILDIQAATHQAARDLAFECAQIGASCPSMVVPTLMQPVLQRRHFSDQSPERDGAASKARLPVFWQDRRGAPLLEHFDDVAISLERQHFNSPLAFARGQEAQALPGAVSLLSDLGGPGRFELDIQGGLFRAQVQTAIARGASRTGWLSELTAMPIQAHSRVAILVDSWSASRPYGPLADSVETRVRAGMRLPTVVERSLNAAWLPVRGVLVVADWLGLESRGGDLRWHEVDVDLLPPDRLGPPSRAVR
jgi:hypothetical protein